MTFEESKKLGKSGEYAVIEALTRKGHTITDLSEIPEYQGKDIDCMVSKNGNSITLEIKNDLKSESTGNFFIEYINHNNVTNSYDGWFYYSEADYICFCQEKSRKAHIVLFEELQENIRQNNYRRVRGGECSYGYLLPLTNLKKFKSYWGFEL